MKISYQTLVGLLLLLSTSVSANLISNPDSSIFSDDEGGSGYFTPVGTSTLFEIIDIAETLGQQGNVFGFYFQGETNSLYSIFDSDDTNLQSAVLNFDNGIVVDVDLAAIQSAFINNNADIGFFVFLPAFQNILMFSDPNLNVNNVDVFGVHRLLSNPNVLGLHFDLGQGTTQLVTASALTPVMEATNPTTTTLVFFGFLLVIFRKKLMQKYLSIEPSLHA